jgi:hypothetical protein
MYRIIYALLFTVLIACNNEEQLDDCNITYSYETDVKSIISLKCGSAGCHNSEFGGDFSTYEGVYEKVNSGTFYTELDEGTMPPISKPQLTDEELNVLKCWSLNGGKE